MANNIHPTAVIDDRVIVGDNVYIGPNCTIGFPAEYKKDFGKETGFTVVIEDGAVITGNVTIDAGTVRHTRIGKNCFIMKSGYIAHDCVIGDDSILSAHVSLGGHVILQDKVNLGMGAIIHPRQIIGALSMVGMGCVVTKKSIIKPGHIYAGNPAKELGLNSIGLERNDISQDMLNELVLAFEELRAK